MDNKLGINKSDILNLTRKLPQSVDDAYEKILNKSPDFENARRLLHIILGAKDRCLLQTTQSHDARRESGEHTHCRCKRDTGGKGHHRAPKAGDTYEVRI